ncbi:AzlC family ABC transporter permease [Micropruina sonneratiae]|uniref:AzlC family ABC transporter permease n=1 Tax=Micropruina sonneratiae TaxID=2986940 RepID=UPI002227728E|nr:AzlC family ABC transporter permease [Micropruina sp. KQZ13P-5]MCW3159518.1 AzlC family ABC transporter permease [Micropruina sp. KQZ13P-5]
MPHPRLTPAVRSGVSIAIAVGLYGAAFGALGVEAGLTVAQTCALSLLMFTGGSQFAFVGVIGGGGTGLSAFAAATLLGLRNGVYAMQLEAMLRPAAGRKALHAQFTIDESMANASAQTDPDEQRRGFWTAGLGIYLTWNLFTLIGALAGNAMGDPARWGLDGAACAAFLGLLWPRLKGRDPIAIAVVCAVATVLFIPLAPPGLPIIIAAVVAAGAWAVLQRRGVPT